MSPERGSITCSTMHRRRTNRSTAQIRANRGTAGRELVSAIRPFPLHFAPFHGSPTSTQFTRPSDGAPLRLHNKRSAGQLIKRPALVQIDRPAEHRTKRPPDKRTSSTPQRQFISPIA
ncbi:unnamed protein product [Protopolystoma xenopodis]|uniref:Uncharacterized protein n=1 Tax=Protopolystoma xenopodis TaxID=117903 RepID=A0A3S5C9I3_9PLAT|nr:unnamed protein product [Protopolystoma xenopodis]